MDIFKIKLLAIATMAIDHLGAYFYPEAIWLRLIGRISFPLFAWMIANGAEKTRDLKNYLIRVWILAFISQVPYMLMNRLDTPGFWELNAIFTLATGLSVIAIWKNTKNDIFRIGSLITAGILSTGLKMDYQAAGVALVLVFYFFRNSKKDTFWAMLSFVGVFYIMPALNQLLVEQTGRVNTALIVNPLQLLVLPIIFLYNGKLGRRFKLGFYTFFPAHYVVMYLIKILQTRV